MVAEVAKELGILTVGIVPKPFAFEGKRKLNIAEIGIEGLQMCIRDRLMGCPLA